MIVLPSSLIVRSTRPPSWQLLGGVQSAETDSTPPRPRDSRLRSWQDSLKPAGTPPACRQAGEEAKGRPTSILLPHLAGARGKCSLASSACDRPAVQASKQRECTVCHELVHARSAELALDYSPSEAAQVQTSQWLIPQETSHHGYLISI